MGIAIATDLFVATLVWVALVVLGSHLLTLIGLNSTNSLDRLVFASALGGGAMAYLVFGLGLVRGYTPWIAWVILIAIFVLCRRQTLESLKDFGNVVASLVQQLRASSRFALCFGMVAAAAVIRLCGALAPPTGVDTFLYHLPIPEAYMKAQGIVFVPSVFPYGEFPQNVEMLFLLSMLLRSSVVAQVVHWGFGILIIAALYVLGQSELKPWQALLGAAVFYAGADVAAQSGSALIDLAVAAYQVLAVIALVRFLEHRRFQWLVLAGLLAGFAAGSKYSGGTVTVALCGMLVWEAMRRRLTWWEAARYSTICFMLSLLLLVPWLMKNWFMVGNPVSPLLSSLFPGQLFREAADAWINSARNYGAFPLPTLGNLAAPVWLTFSPQILAGSYIGPIYLAALPGIVLFPHSLRQRRLLWAVVLLFPLWYFSSPIPRFFLAGIALLTVPAMIALQRLAASRKLVSVMVTGGVLVWCIFGLLGLSLYKHAGAIPYVLGREHREQYLARRLPGRSTRFTWYSEVLWINDNTPRDSVILVQDSRWPYLERDVVRLADWVQTWGDPDICARDSLECLCRAGITHAVLFPGDLDISPLHRSLEELVNNGQLRLLKSGEAASVYEVECAHK